MASSSYFSASKLEDEFLQTRGKSVAKHGTEKTKEANQEFHTDQDLDVL